MVFLQLPTNLSPSLMLFASDRERFERHINPTFSGPSAKNRSDLYTRLRVGGELTLSSEWGARIEYQYAHDLYWTAKANASGDNSDLGQAYVSYKQHGLAVLAGRQRIDLGQMRLIGETDWINQARSLDAVYGRSGAWNAWFGRIAVGSAEPESVRLGAVTHEDSSLGTTSVIYKHDLGSRSDIDFATLDELYAHSFGPIDFDTEAAFQAGPGNESTQEAWAAHFRLGHKFDAKTNLQLEVNSASGGSSRNVTRTFDNLYPSNHDLYGLADMVGWKNMNDLAAKIEYKVNPKTTVRAGAHVFSLRDPSDGWYSATGVLNSRPGGSFIDPTGRSGRELGDEYDLEGSYAAMKYVQFQAGIAFFEPGDFVRNLSGHSNQMTFGFLQMQAKF